MSVEPDQDDVGATTRAVADDMSAIFGAGSRASAGSLVVVKSTTARSATPNRILLACSAATLAVTVAAGVYAGRSATETATTAPTSRAGNTTPPLERRQIGARAVATDAVAATPMASPSAMMTVPDEAGERSSPVSIASAAGPPAPSRASASLPAVVPVVRRPALVIAVPPASSSSQTRQRSDCDEDSAACFASRVDVAERRVADAYQLAVGAGVRQRDLRGYRGEWDRARNVAVEQPREALRLYAMITSDLLNLADDAEARDGAGER